MRHLTPAELVVQLFGGVNRLARELGVAPSTISRLHLPASDRSTAQGGTGSGGEIRSRRLTVAILGLAKARGVPLTCDDLIYGRDVEHAAPEKMRV